MLWPWWKMKGDEGDNDIYTVHCFASFNYDPNNKRNLPIVILKSLGGLLNEAVPINDISLHFDQIDTDDVEKEYPEFIAEWRKNYREEDK